MNLQVESSAFPAGDTIPERYPCDGDDVSPPVSWSELPSGTETLVLIVDDPDAPVGTWVHWLLFNIPSGIRGLEEAVPPTPVVEGLGVQGNNGWRRLGYGGPCPPSGTHRYYFKVYALDTELDLASSSTKKDLLKAMEGHILAEGQLMGKYKRE